jgi:uncharacterized protein YfaS (alpha-2-macroglobulin family)
MISQARVAEGFRLFFWNRKTFVALLVVSPAILATVSSFFMSRWLDDDIARLTRQRDEQLEFSRNLDLFTREVQRYQLDRASLLLLLTGQNSDHQLRYVMDRLYRMNAQSSLRRVVAILYPSDWQQRMQRTEDLLQSDYNGDKAAVDEMQATETKVIEDASKALTTAQANINTLSDVIDEKNSTRTSIVLVGAYLTQLLTIALFFVKTNVK